MKWINQDDLMNWLEVEATEMREIGDTEEAHEASYILKHVREMPTANVKDALQDIKRYCDEQPCCDGCPFWHDPCIGNLPMAFRRIEAKLAHEEER